MQLTSREANLVGAWASGVVQALQEATDAEVAGGGALAAALVTCTLFSGERIDALQPVLGLSASGVVRTVDRLVAAGLAERQASAGDGREVLIYPTRRGARTAERVLKARAALADRLLEPLSGSERETFLKLLAKLLVAMPSDRESARHICRLCDHPACELGWCPVSEGAPGDPHRSRPSRPLSSSR
ncbi:MAG: MarR family winged helix-turn-helix transcriptional regulator [Solirubrobacteraceae bacterium]